MLANLADIAGLKRSLAENQILGCQVELLD
jgi:hypothetical protein